MVPGYGRREGVFEVEISDQMKRDGFLAVEALWCLGRDGRQERLRLKSATKWREMGF